MQFDGKVTIITGGASGIGAASARNFAQRGAKVAIADLNSDGAQMVAAEIGGLGVGCDVGQEAAINELVAQVEAELGPIDIFFSNAGIASGGTPLATDLAVWQQQWPMFMPPVRCYQACWNAAVAI